MKYNRLANMPAGVTDAIIDFGMMRKISLFIVSLIIVLLNSCSAPYEGGQYEFMGTWYVDNQTAHSFEVVVVVPSSYDAKEGVKTPVGPIACTRITPSSFWAWYDLYSQPTTSHQIATITFNFRGGVSHTFKGKVIDCDVRDAENWDIAYKGEQNCIAKHTYTFTNKDYEEIMALYK